MRQLTSSWSLLIVASLLLGACSKPPPEQPPLCRLTTAEASDSTSDTEDADQPLPPVRSSQWFELLVGRANGAASNDCTSGAIRVRPASPECNSGTPTASARPLDDAALTTRQLEVGQHLVFVRTHDLSDGEVLGVVALVEQDHRALTVKALGHLRTRPERLRLRLESVGERTILVADAETCERPDDVASCVREVRFLVQEDDRFSEPEVVREDDGRCIGEPVLRMAREERVAIEGGWERTFRLATSWEIRDGEVLIREQVTALDTKPSEAGMPPRPFRTVDAVRRWKPRGGRFVTADSPLWDRMLTRAGATDVPE